MQLLFRSLVSAWLLAFSTVALAQSPDQENDLARRIQLFFDDLARLDTAALRHHVSSDFVLLEDGSVWNLDSLNQALAKMIGKPFTRTNTIEVISTRKRADVVWISYYNTAHITLAEKKRIIKWLESAVLVKEKSRWKLTLMHSTTISSK